MDSMEDLKKWVASQLESGRNPNDVLGEIEAGAGSAVEQWADRNGWSEWGDGSWMEESACSICGSSVPGICGHDGDPGRVVLRGVAAVARQREAAMVAFAREIIGKDQS